MDNNLDDEDEDFIIKQPILTPEIAEIPKVIIAPSDTLPKKPKQESNSNKTMHKSPSTVFKSFMVMNTVPSR